jgi:phosphatidylethanolamine/phosphatidyl-N-methylethanolamine N-methyltransferase
LFSFAGRWNRLRYAVWAPVYDAIVRAAGFDAARRLSIDRLRLAPGDRVLMVGAGTGLDLAFVSSNVHVTAIDITPSMLQLERRAGRAVNDHHQTPAGGVQAFSFGRFIRKASLR